MRFALWRGDATFLGATPELLISRRGALVLSEALAGSTAAQETQEQCCKGQGQMKGRHGGGMKGGIAVGATNEDGTRVAATYDPPQVGDDRLSAVQYLRFPVAGRTPVAIGTDAGVLVANHATGPDRDAPWLGVSTFGSFFSDMLLE